MVMPAIVRPFEPAVKARELVAVGGPSPHIWAMSNCNRCHPDGVNAVSALFIAHNIPVDALTITEGSLLIVGPEDVSALRVQMSPSAHTALEIFKGDS